MGVIIVEKCFNKVTHVFYLQNSNVVRKTNVKL